MSRLCQFAKICGICAFLVAGCATFDRGVYVKNHTLDNFMADRPQVAELLHQYPACENWLRLKWSQPVENFQLVWQNEAPSHGSMANNVPLHEARLIAVHISKKLNAWDQLICLSFETLNAQGLPHFDVFVAQAMAGTISRAEFIDGIERTEYDAVRQAQKAIPAVLPAPTNGVAHYYESLLKAPAGYENYKHWQQQNKDGNYAHGHELYGRLYDSIAKLQKRLPPATSPALPLTNDVPPVHLN